MKPFYIYAITHVASGNDYIGSTVAPKQRWIHHRVHLKKGTHHCQYLQRAWRKYGANAFAFSILEGPLEGDRVAVEKRWILLRGAYNSMKLDETGRTFVHDPETLAFLTAHWQKYARAPENRERVRQRAIKRWSDPAEREKQADKFRKAWANDPAFKDRQAKMNAAQWGSQEARQARAERNKVMWTDEGYREKMTAGGKARMSDPEFIARILATKRKKSPQGSFDI